MSTTATSSPQPSLDQSKQETFIGKVLADTSGTMTTVLASIGDRLGLFKDLSVNGASTSSELAARTGIHERYAREWLGGMVTAGYLEYDPAAHRFRLPAEHAAALAQEGGPFFFGGIYQMFPAMVYPNRHIPQPFGMDWSGSPLDGSKICCCSSGFPPCQTWKPS